jgi:hypothetical protein
MAAPWLHETHPPRSGFYGARDFFIGEDTGFDFLTLDHSLTSTLSSTSSLPSTYTNSLLRHKYSTCTDH